MRGSHGRGRPATTRPPVRRATGRTDAVRRLRLRHALARRLFEVLRDEDLRRIAVWKLEGHTVDEIAAELGCARRTVARRLELIRTLWRAQAP